jgi:hypothetical protein
MFIAVQNGGTARGYQGILVPLAALTSSGYGLNGRSAEPHIYTFATLEVNVLNCRDKYVLGPFAG